MADGPLRFFHNLILTKRRYPIMLTTSMHRTIDGSVRSIEGLMEAIGSQ